MMGCRSLQSDLLFCSSVRRHIGVLRALGGFAEVWLRNLVLENFVLNLSILTLNENPCLAQTESHGSRVVQRSSAPSVHYQSFNRCLPGARSVSIWGCGRPSRPTPEVEAALKLSLQQSVVTI